MCFHPDVGVGSGCTYYVGQVRANNIAGEIGPQEITSQEQDIFTIQSTTISHPSTSGSCIHSPH